MQLNKEVRRLRYRLNRQGMLELDAWLAPLLQADLDKPELVFAIDMLLASEPPQLQAMMLGKLPLPEELAPYLSRKVVKAAKEKLKLSP